MFEETGDLFSTSAAAIGHGVNVYGVMGAGIAKQFKAQWPDMYEKYKLQCQATMLNPGGVYVYDAQEWVIFNMASQSRPGPDAKLEWLSDAAEKAAVIALGRGIDYIAIPRIGCGIGGLDWSDVKPALESIEEMTGIQFEVWTL